ncbi:MULTISPECIES: hypothetical protein [Acinetobacter]|uniref:hypothetical protein n=1 Tax=Acinetobacter TaxID=469 RepID=UPI0012DF0F0A|nr:MULTISPECIES: hypothetical protein [Acinetobacter]MCK4077530.1 hypothetical protein [Acinetobacter radioresistens]QGR74000.1 hypothetical protein FOB21_04475 [Acinetobacter lwoffii]
MSVEVRISSIDRDNKTVIVEAYNGNSKIFRSPMKYKQETKKNFESILKKELKAFSSAVWGGARVSHSLFIQVGG